MQTPQMSNNAPSNPPTNLSTEQIQQYLDINNQLILAITEGHNLGRHAEKALYMDQLETNLKYLTTLADGEAQSPQPGLPEVQQFFEHPPAIPRGLASVQQAPFASRLPFQQQQHQQPVNLQELEFMATLRGAPQRTYQGLPEAGPSNFLRMSTYGRNKGNMGP